MLANSCQWFRCKRKESSKSLVETTQLFSWLRTALCTKLEASRIRTRKRDRSLQWEGLLQVEYLAHLSLFKGYTGKILYKLIVVTFIAQLWTLMVIYTLGEEESAHTTKVSVVMDIQTKLTGQNR